MSHEQPGPERPPIERETPDDAAPSTKTALTKVGGSRSDNWNEHIGNQVIATTVQKHLSDEQRAELACAAVAGLAGISPRDELEAMMAAQMIAAHNAAMECYRRAMLDGQTFEGRREYLNQANKLSRTHASLVEALNRHRGKGQQKVTVEHVHVHAGGQAVVGLVEGPSPRGGGREKS